ncbi:transcriptional regulatory protein [Salinisphaera dokdonensis CL-ES53]|uniref:Transcriptional regulatory protein n=1 Tax=Salinisphaera dokdonensis CL-ES53 TaxID=1304272 RepID=A0ABV2B256_9GAMM
MHSDKGQPAAPRARIEPGEGAMDPDFEQFKQIVSVSKTDICTTLYRQNREMIRIKKEHVAVKNLVRIIDSTLRLANTTGFSAMSLRDLCNDSGLSMGGLYAYIRNKDDLIGLIQSHGFMLTKRTLLDFTQDISEPREKLFVAIKSHLFLSELMRPWFYFSYMEAKHLAESRKRDAVNVELETESIYRDILVEGIDAGVFRDIDARLLASLIKAMLQDWYLKRGKYRDQGTSVTTYAETMRDVLNGYLIASTD